MNIKQYILAALTFCLYCTCIKSSVNNIPWELYDGSPINYTLSDFLKSWNSCETLRDAILNIYDNADQSKNYTITGEIYNMEEQDVYFDTIINSLEKTYGASSESNLKECLEENILSIRRGTLYDQIAKYIGRISIDERQTGTGTLIGWEGISDDLRGKVVLTVAHNYFDQATFLKEESRLKIPKNIEEIKIRDRRTWISTLKDNDQMYFMIDQNPDNIDLDNDLKLLENAKAYAPGRNNFANESKVESVITIADYLFDDNTTFQIPDIALFILEDTVYNDYMNIDKTISKINNDSNQFFAIGYGMGENMIGRDYFSKYITGWNLKKRIKPFELNQIIHNINVGDFQIPNTPSNSGSPIVEFYNSKESPTYSVTAILGGSDNQILSHHIDWIKESIEEYSKLKK